MAGIAILVPQWAVLHADSRAQCTVALQGIRPAALQRVHQQGLAEMIALCIAPQKERPHAKKLLKHPYFASIREVSPRTVKATCDCAKQPAYLL